MSKLSDLLSNIILKLNSITSDYVKKAEVTAHNTGTDAHNDIRLLIQGLSERLNAIANSDDTTLDDFKEVVAYIKANKALIDVVASSKVSITDIVNNLTTNVSDKPLSASMGVSLKALYDGIDLSPYAKTADVNSALSSYATGATVTALQTTLEKRIKALEDALNGFSFSDGTSAPTSGGAKHITFVDVS